MIKKLAFFTLFIFSYILNAESFLSYVKTPKDILLNQTFEVKVKVIITSDSVGKITNSFEGASNVVVLNEMSKWRGVGSNTYENTFYYKVTNEQYSMPKLSIIYELDKKKYKSKSLSPFRVKIIPLNKDKSFCNVLANKFEVTTYKTTNFDTKHNIVVLRVEAVNSNLEDMKLSFAIRDGINSKEYELPTTKVYYFAIVPKSMKIFKFTYFDLIKNRFELVQIPIEIANDEVSTHFELNPNKNRFLIYKTVTLISLASLFVLLFLYRRKFIFLLIAIIIGSFLAYNRHPLTNKVINSGTKVRILPTPNSTIFYVSSQKETVEILNIKDEYIKVLLPNNSVGWVLNEDFIKN